VENILRIGMAEGAGFVAHQAILRARVGARSQTYLRGRPRRRRRIATV
jgi:hypothetical protein